MAVERNLLVSILRLTKSGPVQRELISRDARVPTQTVNEMLKKFSDTGLIQLKGRAIEVLPRQRVLAAIRAVELGADFERVCKTLEWTEFENIAATAFEANNFHVKKRFRFKWAGRRWEVDILGCKEPIVACVDCKHWQHGWRKSAIMKAVASQVERTTALTEAFPSLYEKAGLADWKQATLIPVVLSLVLGSLKFYNDVPIVPVLQLQNFLTELTSHVNSLLHFSLHFKNI